MDRITQIPAYSNPLKKFILLKVLEILEKDERDLIFLLAGLYGQTVTEYYRLNKLNQ